MPWALWGRKHFENFHVESKHNVADDPSRLVAVRRPVPPPRWLAPLLLADATPRPVKLGLPRERRHCVELYSGRGGLTLAWTQAGLKAGRPYEAYPCDKNRFKTYRPEHDLSTQEVRSSLLAEGRAGRFMLLHVGLPCKTLGPAGRLAGGKSTS